jgi:hypothetical protein
MPVLAQRGRKRGDGRLVFLCGAEADLAGGRQVEPRPIRRDTGRAEFDGEVAREIRTGR